MSSRLSNALSLLSNLTATDKSVHNAAAPLPVSRFQQGNPLVRAPDVKPLLRDLVFQKTLGAQRT